MAVRDDGGKKTRRWCTGRQTQSLNRGDICMNQQLINNKSSVQQFIMKSIVTGVTILMIYYLTIASFIERTVSFMDEVEPFLVQVEPIMEKTIPVSIAEQLKILGLNLLKGGPNAQGFTITMKNLPIAWKILAAKTRIDSGKVQEKF